MKIKTREAVCDLLNNDLAWRRVELSELLKNIKSNNPKNESVFLRSAALLLYAHWEGWIKNAATNYLIFVKSQKLNLDQLDDCFAAIALKQKLNEFQDTAKSTIYTQFIDYIRTNMGSRAVISEDGVIKTQSNLSSEILKQLLSSIGLDYSKFQLKANLIDSQLLFYRNNIAHGHDLIMDKQTYISLHSEILQMINTINDDIQNAVVLSSFKKAP